MDGMERKALTRGELLVKTALGAAAGYGAAALGPGLSRALAAGDHDPSVLNLLLRFEYLEEALYQGATERLHDATPQLAAMIKTFAAHEHQHVGRLTKAIEARGSAPDHKGTYFFAYKSSEVFLRLAAEIERIGIGAYNGALRALKSTDAKELAASIAQVEGRHAAAVRLQGNEEPVPEPFGLVLGRYDALGGVERFTGPYYQS